ncbi:hypothetical protein [Nocardioides sp. SYSU D00038]|uniref:hypothetical protein n=1 Tax=Nocardioides sp. SYSU D00038 TaxID=2812554 RepID=UPI0019688840|nr:hypothetical protein [Nocardioides sp. SYSU D00038]
MTPRAALAAPALLVVLSAGALTGCSEAEDAVNGATDRAACEVAQAAVDEVADQARSLADRIGADPQAARRELSALRDTLAAAEKGLGGETREQVRRARDAVDALLAEAKQAADGSQVDDAVVRESRRELDRAVEELSQVC